MSPGVKLNFVKFNGCGYLTGYGRITCGTIRLDMDKQLMFA